MVSIITFGLSYLATNAGERRQRMPVLSTELGPGTLTIRNIGAGPAVNIALAGAKGKLASEDLRMMRLTRRALADDWESVQWHLRPIPPGDQRRYHWNWSGALGLSYTDALGAPYTLVTSGHGSRVVDRAIMPDVGFPKMKYLPEARPGTAARTADGE